MQSPGAARVSLLVGETRKAASNRGELWEPWASRGGHLCRLRRVGVRKECLEEVSLEGSPEGLVEGQPTAAEAEGHKHGDKKTQHLQGPASHLKFKGD